MSKEKIYIFDTTLRDGAQTEGVTFSIDDKNKILYVVTKDNNSLYIVNLIQKKVIQQIALSAEAYSCILSNNKKELYISLWGIFWW